MNAQINKLSWYFDREDYLEQALRERNAQMQACAADPIRPYQKQEEMFDQEIDFWWNGTAAFVRGFDPDGEDDENRRVLGEVQTDDVKPVYVFQRKKTQKGTVVSIVGHAGWTYSFEQVGPWQMLIIRNEKRSAVDLFIKTDINDFQNRITTQTFDLHDLLDGVYVGPEGKKAVFGPRYAFYTDLNFSRDPGCFFASADESYHLQNMIMYGDGRVSHGDPSSPNYGKMPGGGGAGALMGPMIWQIMYEPLGLKVHVVEDQKFVDHSPNFGTTDFKLERICGPYQGMKGRYTVASVRPLPKGLLRLLPKGDLGLIKQEILDRHVEQPRPTAIEQLNLELITTVLNEK